MQLCVYDPEVEDKQIYQDLGTEKFEWDHPSRGQAAIAGRDEIKVVKVGEASIAALVWI